MPISRRVILVPVTIPWPGSFKEFPVIRTFISFFAERSLTHRAPEVVHDLVLQNSYEPGSLRTAAFEVLVSLQCCQKSLLHRIFGGVIVSQSKHGIPEKIIAVVVQPTTRIWGFTGGHALRLVHTGLSVRVVHTLVHSNMSGKTCRDCGNVLEYNARGCPRCAMNFEAETMIDRFIWRRFVPCIIVLALLIVAFVYFLRTH
jgi:hypothetical protein